MEGEIEEGKLYEEFDFNRSIEIREREAKWVQIFLDDANQNEKAIIFCATKPCRFSSGFGESIQNRQHHPFIVYE
ncbi:MAG: hypothetical protein R2728_02405 [Chitinophagales bacterium]